MRKRWLAAPRSGRGMRFLALLITSVWCITAFAAPKPAPWLVVRGEFFDVYTNSSEAAAIDTAVWLEQFRRAISSVWRIDPRSIRRATIVRFRNERDFEPYRSARYKAGYFARDDAVAIMALRGGWSSVVEREIVQHEATHWLTSSMRGRPPVWFVEGLAEVYSSFEIEGDRCTLFRTVDDNLRWLQSNGLDSLRKTLLMQRHHLDYDDREQVGGFYAHAWLVVHYLLCGEGAENGGARLGRYLTMVEGGKPVDAAFAEAFGTDYPGLERKLSAYLHGGRYTSVSMPFAREELRKVFTAEPAPAAEVETALSLLLLMGMRDLDGAELRLSRAAEGAPDSPWPHEGLGCVARARGQLRTAADHFTEAAKRGSRHPYAFYLPAWMEMRDRLGSNGLNNSLRVEDARRLSDALLEALRLNPTLDRAAAELGLALMFTEPLRKDDIRFLVSVASGAEDPEVPWYRVAGLLVRLGDVEQARRILERLAASTGNERLKGAIEKDLASLAAGKTGARIGVRPVNVIKPAGPAIPKIPIKIPKP